jgi:hypothetical protein
VPGALNHDGWAAPPLSELIVRTRTGATRPGSHADAGAPGEREVGQRVVADLLAVRGAAGRFLVPATPPATAARSLLSYNRLRPRRVRTVRAGIGWALRLGFGGFLSEPRRIAAGPDAAVLLDHLAAVLGEPRVVFAATEKGGSGFVTPVLQLFSPDGRAVGFAKIGWDPVTAAMIRAEADGLRLAGAAQLESVAVPEVRWCGEWEDLWLLVTAPMPSDARRLRAGELPPIAPLRDVVALDGPPVRRRVLDAPYWGAAEATADIGAHAGRPALAAELARVAGELGDAEVTFGRWHGDWVEWNLARAGGRLYAWDWAYSAPDVPFGFDLLQFFHLRHLVLREEAPEAALANAAADARAGLRELGIPADEVGAVVALHRIEVLLREERARQARTGVTT